MYYDKSKILLPYCHYQSSESTLWILQCTAPTYAANNGPYPYSCHNSHVPRRFSLTPAINYDTSHSPATDCPCHHITSILEYHSREGVSSTHSTAHPSYSYSEATPCSLAHSHDCPPCNPTYTSIATRKLIEQTKMPSRPYSKTSTSQTTASHTILTPDGSCRLLIPSPQGRLGH